MTIEDRVRRDLRTTGEHIVPAEPGWDHVARRLASTARPPAKRPRWSTHRGRAISLAGLAVAIVQRQAEQEDQDEVAQMLAEIEQLSEEEALSLYANSEEDE